MFGKILTAIIYAGCAAIAFGIGFAQRKSKKPVTFYNGEKALRPEQLSDVTSWNLKHGNMWLIYGGIMLASCIGGWILGDSIYSLIPLLGGVMIPLPIMCIYHNKLLREYKLK